MKRRILSLLVVLCLALSVLAITTFAAQPTITVKMAGLEWIDVTEGEHKYATTDAETKTATECTESDNWNIHLDYTTGKTPTLYLNGATLNTATQQVPAISVTTTGAFVLHSVEGSTNTITSTVTKWSSNPLYFGAAKGTTITGTGKLIAENRAVNTSSDWSSSAIRTEYNLTFDHADVNLLTDSARQGTITIASSSGDSAAHCPGEVTFKGGKVHMESYIGQVVGYLRYGYSMGETLNPNLTKNIYIQDGAEVTCSTAGTHTIFGLCGGGKVYITNGTFQYEKTAFTTYGTPTNFPELAGTHLVEYNTDKTTMKSFMYTGNSEVDSLDADYIAPGTDLKTAEIKFYNYLKISHVCTHDGLCTAGGVCKDCGAKIEAKAHTYENFDATACTLCGATRPTGVYATIKNVNMDTSYGETRYATMAADGTVTEVDANAAWNIRLDYTGDVPVLSLQNFEENTAGYFNLSGKGALQINVLTDVSLKNNGVFTLGMEEGTTITSVDGSTLTMQGASQYVKDFFKVTTGSLTFRNANVNIPATGYAYDTVGVYSTVEVVDGDVTISGGSVTIECSGNADALKVNGNVTVEKGAIVYLYSKGYGAATNITGDIRVKNSNVYLRHTWSTPAEGRAMKYLLAEMPVEMENVSAIYATSASNYLKPNYQKPLAANTTSEWLLNPANLVQYIAITHTCPAVEDCTAGLTCDCGNVIAPVDHTPNADDGDCTTAVNCSVCGKVATPATDHVAQEGTYICTDAIPCVNCDKNFREAGNHTPNADDGNCTTAITCSVCDAVTTPAESAHKYTDLDDTTCDNAGCIATRLAGLHVTISGVNMDILNGETKYATMSETGAVALVDENAAWNIKIDFINDVPVLSLQNITAAGGYFNLRGTSALQIDVLTDVTITSNVVFTLSMEGGTTISSPTGGVLTVNMSSTSGTKLMSVPVGTLTFQNANVSFYAIRSSSYTAGEYAGVDVAGDVIFSGGTAVIDGGGSNMALKVGGDLIVEKGANVTLYSSGYGSAADVTGEIKVNNATLTGIHTWGTPSATKWLFNKVPAEMVGVNAVYSTSQWNYALPNYQKVLTAETDILDWENNKIYYIALTHTCVVEDCAVETICACGNVIAPAEHVFDNDCTTADKCANCAQVAEAKDHTAGEAVKEHETDSTCTVAGTYDEVVYCSVCNAEMSRETKDKELADHTAGEAVHEHETDSTCTVAGTYEKVVYCSVCGWSISHEIVTKDLAPHNTNGNVTHVDATCTTTGVVGGTYCDACNEGKEAAETTIPVTDHTPGAPVVENATDATCGEAGSYEEAVYCSGCGVEMSRETKTVEALPHTYDDEYDAKCNVCGATRDDALTLVAMIGNKKYTSLIGALEEAQAGQTIVLYRNSKGAALEINKNATINFNGFTYSVTEAIDGAAIVNNAVLTLTGNTKGGTLELSYADKEEFSTLIKNNDTLNVDDLTLKAIHMYGADPVDQIVVDNANGTTVTITDTTISCRKKAVAINVVAGATVTVEGNSVIGGKVVVAEGTLNMNGGTYTYGVNYTSGTMTKVEDVDVDAPEGYCWNNGVLSVHDWQPATLNAPETCSNCKLTRGSALTGAIAQIGNVKYASLWDALDHAEKGDEIKLLKNSKGAALVINQDVTINFNGYVYSVNEAVDGAAIVNNAVLTLTGGSKGGTLEISYADKEEFSIMIANNGTLNLEDVTVKAIHLYGDLPQNTIVVDGGDVTTTADSVVTKRKAAVLGFEM